MGDFFMQENDFESKNHIITLDARRNISISGVIDVVGFDETCIELTTEGGKLTIDGGDIQITALDVESGKLTASGRFDSISYADAEKQRRGFFSRLIK